jgi:hypothetical protein
MSRRTLLSLFLLAAACGADDAGTGDGDPPAGAGYVLGSVVIDADGARTTYVQTIASLDAGPFDNQRAIELPGNGVLMAHGRSFYVIA